MSGGHTSVESILANPLNMLVTEPAPEYGTGRVCDWSGCVTVLSRYHGGCYCYAHEPEDDGYEA